MIIEYYALIAFTSPNLFLNEKKTIIYTYCYNLYNLLVCTLLENKGSVKGENRVNVLLGRHCNQYDL